MIDIQRFFVHKLKTNNQNQMFNRAQVMPLWKRPCAGYAPSTDGNLGKSGKVVPLRTSTAPALLAHKLLHQAHAHEVYVWSEVFNSS